MNDITAILQQRGERYGAFAGHAKVAQDIKRAMAASANWDKLTDDKREALEMIAHKIARVLNGDPEYYDSWIDISGYTELVIKELRRMEHNT